MTQTTPNKSKIAASLSLILGTALSSGVMSSATAQETEKDIEVIQVSGIRSSVQESMGIKRDSAGVVDAISAEDIGKFPDTNLAESLQRITVFQLVGIMVKEAKSQRVVLDLTSIW